MACKRTLSKLKCHTMLHITQLGKNDENIAKLRLIEKRGKHESRSNLQRISIFFSLVAGFCQYRSAPFEH